MNKVTLNVKNESNDLVESFQVEISNDIHKRLVRYIENCERIRQTTLLERGMPMLSNFTWKHDEGYKFQCTAYSNAELHELLHVLRPVILSREPYSFEKTCALLSIICKNVNFDAWLKVQRRLYNDGELSFYMQFQVNNQPVFDRSFISLWLNAVQYHTDEEKFEAWKNLESAVKTDNARAIVITQLQGRVKAILNIAAICYMLTDPPHAA